MAMKHLLLTTQKNVVHELIRKHELDPSHFEWREESGDLESKVVVSTLIHEPSGYYCKFDVYQDPYGNWQRCTVFSPGTSLTVEKRWLESWGNQVVACEDWIASLRREVQAPDLWGCTAHDKSLAVAVSYPEDDNTSFSQTERQDIATQLGEIRRLILASTELGQE